MWVFPQSEKQLIEVLMDFGKVCKISNKTLVSEPIEVQPETWYCWSEK